MTPMHPIIPRWRRRALALSVALGCSAMLPAYADDRIELERLRATTQALIEALVSQGLLTRERADTIVRQAAAAAATAPAPGSATPGAARAAGTPPDTVAAAKVIRVPYIPETLKAQLREEIRYDVLAIAREERWADPRQIPTWVQGIRLDGDLRLRAQAERFARPLYAFDPATGLQLGDACSIVGGNLPARCYRRQTDSPAWAPDIASATDNRDRLTLRARLGVNARVSSDISAGLRFSTGSTSGPTSSSQTLGTYFNKTGVVLD